MAITEADAGGKVLWELPLAAPVEDLVLADVDGDGMCELIAATSDGLVRIFR